MTYPVHQQQQQQQQHFGNYAAPALRDWTTGLFDCCQPSGKLCAEGFFCAYCQLGYQYSRINTGELKMDALITFGGMLADYCFALGLVKCIMTYTVRQAIGRRYGIGVNCCSDCFWASTCCNACALCQQHRELSVMGEYCGGVCVDSPTVAIGAPPVPMMIDLRYPPAAQMAVPSVFAAQPVQYGQPIAYGNGQPPKAVNA